MLTGKHDNSLIIGVHYVYISNYKISANAKSVKKKTLQLYCSLTKLQFTENYNFFSRYQNFNKLNPVLENI